MYMYHVSHNRPFQIKVPKQENSKLRVINGHAMLSFTREKMQVVLREVGMGESPIAL